VKSAVTCNSSTNFYYFFLRVYYHQMPDDRAEADEKDKGKRAESDDDEEEIDRPIPTVNGGYSHTKSSKRKIGQANKGKTPWNKGKRRTEIEKAKISAGVKKNKEKKLQEKLTELGLTEDGYIEQKKDKKLKRDNARRRERAREKKQEKERLLKENQQNKKKQDKVSTEETTIAKKQPKSTTNKKSLPQSSKSKPQQKVISSSETSGKSSAVTNSISKPETVCSFDDDFQISPSASSDIKSPNEQKSSSKTATSSAPSTTAHKKGVNNVLKRKKCKNGGPGGLICCSECNALYSRYLVFTHREMERIAVQKVSQEVSELIVLLEESRNRLKDSFERVDNNRDRRFDFLDASSFYLTENNNPNKIGRRRGTSIGSCGGGLFQPHHLELDMSNAMDAYNSGG